MKRNPIEVKSRRLLILSDGKPGHVNQSIAFAKHLGYDFDLSLVRFKSRWAKGLSYLYDRCGLLNRRLFSVEVEKADYVAIVSAGSDTYFANRVLASELKTKSVAIMLPKGYRYHFDLIVAQQHDQPPKRNNLISIPINLSYVEPKDLVKTCPGRKSVSVIIGGNSKLFTLDPARLRQQLEMIFPLFPGYEFWVTTSRRTPPEIETLLKEFPFSYAVFYSEQQINPIPDFLSQSEYVFLTADSTSMISEAVSFGNAFVEVLPLTRPLANNDKFSRFIHTLVDDGCLHLFNGQLGHAAGKINLPAYFSGICL